MKPLREQHPRPARPDPGRGVGTQGPPVRLFPRRPATLRRCSPPGQAGSEGAAAGPAPTLLATSQCHPRSSGRWFKNEHKTVKLPRRKEAGFAGPPGTLSQNLCARVRLVSPSPPRRPEVVGAECRKEPRPQPCPRVRAARGPLALRIASRLRGSGLGCCPPPSVPAEWQPCRPRSQPPDPAALRELRRVRPGKSGDGFGSGSAGN